MKDDTGKSKHRRDLWRTMARDRVELMRPGVPHRLREAWGAVFTGWSPELFEESGMRRTALESLESLEGERIVSGGEVRVLRILRERESLEARYFVELVEEQGRLWDDGGDGERSSVDGERSGAVLLVLARRLEDLIDAARASRSGVLESERSCCIRFGLEIAVQKARELAEEMKGGGR